MYFIIRKEAGLGLISPRGLPIKSPDNKLAVIILSNEMVPIPTDLAPSRKLKDLGMLDCSFDSMRRDINTQINS